jgi:hypothetical protein
VKAVTKNTKYLVSQRFLTRYDGDRLIEEARAADVP